MSLTFGTKGLTIDERMVRAALHDVAFCAAEARTVSYSTQLVLNWIELRQIAEMSALRHGATPAQVTAARRGVA